MKYIVAWTDNAMSDFMEIWTASMHAPLGVDFWVDEVNRRVYVTAAWPASEDK